MVADIVWQSKHTLLLHSVFLALFSDWLGSQHNECRAFLATLSLLLGNPLALVSGAQSRLGIQLYGIGYWWHLQKQVIFGCVMNVFLIWGVGVRQVYMQFYDILDKQSFRLRQAEKAAALVLKSK